MPRALKQRYGHMTQVIKQFEPSKGGARQPFDVASPWASRQKSIDK